MKGHKNFWFILVVFLFVLGVTSYASPLVPWKYTMKEMETDHFVVIYPEGQENLAREVAIKAEKSYMELVYLFSSEVDTVGKIPLVIVPDVALANGFSVLLGWPSVYIFPSLPDSYMDVDNFKDYPRMLLSHELGHLFSLTTTSGFYTFLRKVFGAPSPNIFIPGFLQEGISITVESDEKEKTGRWWNPKTTSVWVSDILDATKKDLPQLTGSYWGYPLGIHYTYGSEFSKYLCTVISNKTAFATFFRNSGGEFLYGYKNAFGKTYKRNFDGVFRKQFEDTFTLLQNLSTNTQLYKPLFILKEGEINYIKNVGDKYYILVDSVKDENKIYSIDKRMILDSVNLKKWLEESKRIITAKSPSSKYLLSDIYINSFDMSPSGYVYYSGISFSYPYSIKFFLYQYDPKTKNKKLISLITNLKDISIIDNNRILGTVDANFRENIVLVDLSQNTVKILREGNEGEDFSYPQLLDEHRMVYVKKGTERGLFLYNIDSNQEVKLSEHTYYVESFLVKDNRIFYTAADTNGFSQLFSIDLQNLETLQHTYSIRGVFKPFDIIKTEEGEEALCVIKTSRGDVIASFALTNIYISNNIKTNTIQKQGETEIAIFTEQVNPTYSPFKYLLPEYWIPIFPLWYLLALVGIPIYGTDIEVGGAIYGHDPLQEISYMVAPRFDVLAKTIDLDFQFLLTPLNSYILGVGQFNNVKYNTDKEYLYAYVSSLGVAIQWPNIQLNNFYFTTVFEGFRAYLYEIYEDKKSGESKTIELDVYPLIFILNTGNRYAPALYRTPMKGWDLLTLGTYTIPAKLSEEYKLETGFKGGLASSLYFKIQDFWTLESTLRIAIAEPYWVYLNPNLEKNVSGIPISSLLGINFYGYGYIPIPYYPYKGHLLTALNFYSANLVYPINAGFEAPFEVPIDIYFQDLWFYVLIKNGLLLTDHIYEIWENKFDISKLQWFYLPEVEVVVKLFGVAYRFVDFSIFFSVGMGLADYGSGYIRFGINLYDSGSTPFSLKKEYEKRAVQYIFGNRDNSLLKISL